MTESTQAAIGGLLRAGARDRGLQILATRLDSTTGGATGYYELREDLELARTDGDGAQWMRDNVALPTGVVRRVGDSMLYVDDAGGRWRLPIGNPEYERDDTLTDRQRTAREVVTERDLFQCAGTFFELPARNAGGFAKLRPIATHPFFVHDFCSWRGLLVLTGLRADAVDRGARPKPRRACPRTPS
ncbi:MAG: hypothetical protein GY711_31670 [bacterium]|nr:hypothetical protein [bacterium]